MNKKTYSSLMVLAIAVLSLIATASAVAQDRQKTTVAAAGTMTAASSLLPTLPTSDVAMFVDVQKILNDAMPRALAGDKVRLAKINTEIDDFKMRYGIDARSFERVAVGLRFINRSETVTTTDTVALAQGRFNSGAMIAAARIAMKGKYQEQKYGKQTIYTFTINDRVKWLGLLNMRVSDISMAAIDANTLAIGDLELVRAAIDAHDGRGRISPELVQLATRNPNAMLGFAANMPPFVGQHLDLGNEEISKSVASIHQAYGSIGTTATGYDMLMIARTEKPEQARNLNDSFAALKQFSSFIIAQLPADKGKLAQSVIDNMKVTTEGNDLQIRLELAQTDIARLVTIF